MTQEQHSDFLEFRGSSSPERSERSAPVDGPPETDILTLLGIFVRRWYVIVPGLVLAVVAAYLVNDAAVPEYEADGTLMLVSGAGGDEEDGDGDGQEGEGSDVDGQAAAGASQPELGVAVSGRAVAEVVMGDRVRLELLERGLTADYTVTYESDGALLRVWARSPDESEVVPTAEAALEAIREELDARQDAAGVPAEERIGLDLLAQPSAPVPEQVEDEDGGFATVYVARGVVALVGTVFDDGYADNPLRADRATSQLLTQIMDSDAMQDRILGESETTYRVRQNRRDSAPFLYVSTSGPDPDRVLHTFGTVRAALQEELADRQQAAAASPESWVTLETISAPTEATTLGGEGLRPALTVFALIAALAFALALLLESILNAVKRRRHPEEPRLPLLYGGEARQPESGLERTH